jgi:hypothetical protein
MGSSSAVVSLSLWLSIAIGLVGCEAKTHSPLPPAPDARITDSSVFLPRPDGRVGDGGADTGMDAATDARTDVGDATTDAALPLGCVVAGVGTETTVDIVAGGVTYPFTLNRAFATWDPARCLTEPAVIVGLTEGSCRPSVGDQLVFSIERDAVGTFVTVGSNAIFTEPDDVGLRVRFRTAGTGEWGTCAESFGTIDFSSLDTVVGSRLTASYDLTLGDCRGSADPVVVTGTFDLPLEISFESVCL